MEISCFTTCVGEKSSAFLSFFWQNLRFFDDTLIITDLNDFTTSDFCDEKGIKCLRTNVLYKNGARFNRGAALNQGFELINPQSWIVHLDIDILLPDNFREDFYSINPDIENFYSARRIFIPKFRDCAGLFDDTQENKDRISKFETPFGIGYGFCQLWNVNSEVVKINGLNYPESNDVNDSDWWHRNKWGETINGDREYVGKLKELPFKVFHLGVPGVENSGGFWKNE